MKTKHTEIMTDAEDLANRLKAKSNAIDAEEHKWYEGLEWLLDEAAEMLREMNAECELCRLEMGRIEAVKAERDAAVAAYTEQVRLHNLTIDEVAEQARLLGMSGSREAALLTLFEEVSNAFIAVWINDDHDQWDEKARQGLNATLKKIETHQLKARHDFV